MTNIELFISALCPFAARARLVLAEKQLACNEVEIDLRRKPDWFLQMSPHGKVPLLHHDGRLVWESAVIAEYLEEVFPAQPLLPKDPARRAQARAWANFADSRLYAKTAALLHSFDGNLYVRLAAQIVDDLHTLEEQAFAGQTNDGPYVLGTEFSLADVALYPWFEQVAVLERFRGFRCPIDCTRLLAWQRTMADRKAVRAVSKPTKFYLDGYAQLQKQLAG